MLILPKCTRVCTYRRGLKKDACAARQPEDSVGGSHSSQPLWHNVLLRADFSLLHLVRWDALRVQTRRKKKKSTTHSVCHRRGMSVSHLVTAALVSHWLAASLPALSSGHQRRDMIVFRRCVLNTLVPYNNKASTYSCAKHKSLWAVYQRWRQRKRSRRFLLFSFILFFFSFWRDEKTAAAKWCRLHWVFELPGSRYLKFSATKFG